MYLYYLKTYRTVWDARSGPAAKNVRLTHCMYLKPCWDNRTELWKEIWKKFFTIIFSSQNMCNVHQPSQVYIACIISKDDKMRSPALAEAWIEIKWICQILSLYTTALGPGCTEEFFTLHWYKSAKKFGSPCKSKLTCNNLKFQSTF